MRCIHKYLFIAFVGVMTLLSETSSAQAPKWPGIRDSLYSNILKENRIIQVILPKDYKADSGMKYEVLYILDGEWYMEQTPYIYNYTVSSGFAPENIFVLMPNTYVNGVNLRDRDFSPTKMEFDPATGGADNFHAFLKDELIPYVEKKYPVNGQRSLIGSSFSGLFSVYAFVKEPTLFQSFIASDPNLNWDNNYVPKLAAEKLPTFTGVKSTLFFAGINVSSKGMGSRAMDSVMRAKAPAGLPWKFIDYADETHYSVQHKAFYDGMRFSHEGYSKTTVQFHPMNGIMEDGMQVKLIMLSRNPTARYTTDGSQPTISSPLMNSEFVMMPAPGEIKIATFPNRKEDVQVSSGTFKKGVVAPSASKTKKIPELKYYVYEGNWTTLPETTKKLKPAQSGVVKKEFNINKVFFNIADAVYIVEGSVEVLEDAYYVFAVMADGAKLQVGGQVFIDIKSGINGIQSFGAPLKKGFYSLKLEVLKKKGGPDVVFFCNRTKSGNDKWWETQFLSVNN